jgi:acyl carrier protein
MSVNAESILSFLEDDIGLDTSDIEAESLLFSSGIIDSFALINLITFIETEAGIRVSPADVNLDNLDSVSRIVAYVEKVRG